LKPITEFIQNLSWSYVLIAVAALLAITFHEFCHGFAAYKMGDPTAKKLGRLSLNPIKHIDILGLIMLIIAGFGWAKPVPVNMRNFKSPKRGMAITALAGPISSLLLAFIALLFVAILLPFENTVTTSIVQFLILLANISAGLGVFNFIPIPPLDGSKVLLSFLPDNVYYNILKYEFIGMIALIYILSTGLFSPFLSSARSIVINGLWFLARTPLQGLYGII
jgi:Zn-dependent protease